MSSLSGPPYKCNLCGSSDARLVLEKRDTDRLLAGKYKLLKCTGCGFAYVNPVPDECDLKTLYNFDAYYGVRKGKKSNFSIMEDFFYTIRSRKIESLAGRGKILDVGCGSGKFLYFMKKKGWHVYGVESSESGAGIGTEIYGLDVFRGSLEETRYPENFFDVITMWHVLEHIADPSALFSELRRIIKPGGVLFVAVPNIESAEARIFGKNWFHLDIPRHICHYSPAAIGRFASLNGFRVAKINYFSLEHNVAGMLQSTLNAIGCEFNFFYNMLKRGAENKSGSHYYSVIMSWLLATAGMPVVLLLTELASLLKLSGCMEAHLVADDR